MTKPANEADQYGEEHYRLLIKRAREMATLAQSEGKLGPLNAPYAAIILLALADKVETDLNRCQP